MKAKSIGVLEMTFPAFVEEARRGTYLNYELNLAEIKGGEFIRDVLYPVERVALVHIAIYRKRIAVLRSELRGKVDEQSKMAILTELRKRLKMLGILQDLLCVQIKGRLNLWGERIGIRKDFEIVVLPPNASKEK
jgi:hypothetical protein